MVGRSSKGFSYREANALARRRNQHGAELTAGIVWWADEKRMRGSQFRNNLRTKRK